MNSRPKFLLLAPLAAALACSACGGARELQQGDPAALVSAPAQLLARGAPAPEARRRAFTPVVAPGGGLELADESISEKNERHRYEIGFTFPRLKGRSRQQFAKFNRAVRALAERAVRDFKRAYGGPDAEPPDGETWGDVYNFLRGGYEITHLDGDLASLRFDLYTYGRGAAHPVHSYAVLNVDLKTGRVLRLGDLFKPGTQPLRALAAYSVADLKRQDEEEHRRAVARAVGAGQPASRAGVRTADSDFQSGAGPADENYRAWNLAAEGVVVSFAACQVGSCADGAQEVLVPFAALDAVLSQSSPAARLFTRP